MNKEIHTDLYHPKSALVFYESTHPDKGMYVEHFDMDDSGSPVNAHPLTVREAERLARALKTTTEKTTPGLTSDGIIGSHILQVDAAIGQVIWYTKAMPRTLYFTRQLGIPEGRAEVPPMLWKADRQDLSVFALKTDRRPTERSPLYYAPFFNVYDTGSVCMGTVDVQIKKTASLETFTATWEEYFFNSYFSHLMHGHNPVKGNCVTLWEGLIESGEPFPKSVLKPTRQTLKDLLL